MLMLMLEQRGNKSCVPREMVVRLGEASKLEVVVNIVYKWYNRSCSGCEVLVISEKERCDGGLSELNCSLEVDVLW